MKKWLFGIISISVLVWALASDLSIFVTATSFFSVRRSVILLTGLSLFALMGFSMVLALRLPVLERWIGGLDQIYHLHKWAGISAVIFLAAHYLSVDMPKWLTRAGLMERPVRGGGGPRSPDTIVTWSEFRHLAESVGEWILYIMPVVALIALIRLIPWRAFRYIHKLFPLIFLGSAFHSVALMPSFWWTLPAGIWLVFWATVGSLAALWSLADQIGRRRRHQGVIRAARFIPEARTLEIDVDLPARPMPHEAGQFAFLRFPHAADAHPFTIASANAEGTQVRFAIKTLGDYTRRLPDLAQPGQAVRVEGPYGRFTFAGPQAQIWVAGGIGITPFLARLDALAQAGGASEATVLHYCAADREAARWPEDLAARCAAAGVTLHTHIASEGNLLNADILTRARGDKSWPGVWFCGPAGFAKSLRGGLTRLGLPGRLFHAEKFQMR